MGVIMCRLFYIRSASVLHPFCIGSWYVRVVLTLCSLFGLTHEPYVSTVNITKSVRYPAGDMLGVLTN